MSIDFGLTANDYSRHRAGFPDSLYPRLLSWQIGLPQQRIIDLGTGTGSLARGLARQGSRVMGLDPAAPLLVAAQNLDREAGVNVSYLVGRAEATGLVANSVDVVTAGQCWHWFDRPAVAAEVARILRPNGRILIVHFDWIPLPGNVVAATEKLILAHNPTWSMDGGNGMYPQWLTDLGSAGYRNLKSFSYDLDVPYTHEAWRGRIRASAGVGASLTPAQVAVFDHALAELLAMHFPDPILPVFHRVFALTAQVEA